MLLTAFFDLLQSMKASDRFKPETFSLTSETVADQCILTLELCCQRHASLGRGEWTATRLLAQALLSRCLLIVRGPENCTSVRNIPDAVSILHRLREVRIGISVIRAGNVSSRLFSIAVCSVVLSACIRI